MPIALFDVAPMTLAMKVPYYTTAAGSAAVAQAITSVKVSELEVRSLQDYYA